MVIGVNIVSISLGGDSAGGFWVWMVGIGPVYRLKFLYGFMQIVRCELFQD